MTYAFDKSTGNMVIGKKVLENAKAIVLSTSTGHKIIRKTEKMRFVTKAS